MMNSVALKGSVRDNVLVSTCCIVHLQLNVNLGGFITVDNFSLHLLSCSEFSFRFFFKLNVYIFYLLRFCNESITYFPGTSLI